MPENPDISTNQPGPYPSPERHPTNIASRLTSTRQLGRLGRLERVMNALSPGERLLLYALSILLAGSALALLINVNRYVTTTVPSYGGELREGAIGTPRFINPLLAISQTDQDLTVLMYSGLTRVTQGGELIPDLAQDYDVSDDGMTYTFHIRDDAMFHDGTRVKAEDVVFTVSLAQNEDTKSPRRADWDGVTASAKDERTVVFTLPHAYAPFLENTQLGILPKHLWNTVSAEEFPFHALNTHPVGSGPYMLKDVKTDDTGSSVAYELGAFDGFALGKPHLNSIIFRFYPNEDTLQAAFAAGEVDSFAGAMLEQMPRGRREDTHVVRTASTRVFGIFFNQNHAPVLADASVRSALEAAVDREQLIDSILAGYGKAANGPIPPGLLDASDASATTSTATTTVSETGIEEARSILSDGGWKFEEPTASSTTAGMWTKGTKNKQVLSFALATADTPELSATANAVAAAWREVGIDVDVQVYPLAEFNANVLRPRSYDAVLFGEVVGRTLDLFAFWHSSQRNDPGLNLALYANSRADKLLADARTEVEREKREELYRSFSEIIADDEPAVFLYSPEFLYVVPNTLLGLSFGSLTTPSERFLNVHTWFTDTERIWNIFSSRISDPQL